MHLCYRVSHSYTLTNALCNS